nr:lactonase family protein [Paenibacillus phyllosphaerae]
MLVFAGSYAETEDHSIYSFVMNEASGELTQLDQVSGFKNPTFLNVDAEQRRLYAISEATTAEGKKAGEAASFAFDPISGSIKLLNRALTVSGPTCHIQRDDQKPYLIVVSYHGGMAGLLEITDNGEIGQLLDTQQHEGKGAHPERQDRPHPHSTFFSPDGRFVLIQDLGLDKIFIYAIDRENGKLNLHGTTNTHPGAGPRHLAFHPNGNYAFVINEVDSSITSYAWNQQEGTLTSIETVPTLPAGGFAGENTTAEIAVSNDGRFLYGSNRGHDSIVVHAIDPESGRLTLVQHESTQGGHPRHFAMTPNGQYLLCANRDGNNIVTFRVDQESGRISPTGNSITVSKPVCVQPVYVNV